MEVIKGIVSDFFKALKAKDYVMSLIILALIVAYVTRYDSKEDKALSRADLKECRDAIATINAQWQRRLDVKDSTNRAEMAGKDLKYDALAERYLSEKDVNNQTLQRIVNSQDKFTHQQSETRKGFIQTVREVDLTSKKIDSIIKPMKP